MNTADWIKQLKLFISNGEKRIAEYKKLLEQLYKEKNLYYTEDFEWYKQCLRDAKNDEERILKGNIAENIRAQLNYNSL